MPALASSALCSAPSRSDRRNGEDLAHDDRGVGKFAGPVADCALVGGALDAANLASASAVRGVALDRAPLGDDRCGCVAAYGYRLGQLLAPAVEVPC